MAGGGLGVVSGGIWWPDSGCVVAQKGLGDVVLLLGVR